MFRGVAMRHDTYKPLQNSDEADYVLRLVIARKHSRDDTHASVMNAGQETMRLLYGEIRQGAPADTGAFLGMSLTASR